MLENWIENGGECKLVIYLLSYLETRKVMWQIAYYLLVKKRIKFKMPICGQFIAKDVNLWSTLWFVSFEK
jgi:hypothetical protein